MRYIVSNKKLILFYDIILNIRERPITYIEKKYGIEKFTGCYMMNDGKLRIDLNDKYVSIFRKLLLERNLKNNKQDKKGVKI